MSDEAMAAAAAAASPPAEGADANAPVEGEPTSSLSHEDAVAALGKTRKEAADYRTKFSPYRDAFEGIDDGTRDVVLDAVGKLKGGDIGGVTEWLELGKRMMSPEEFQEWAGLPAAKDPKPASDTPPALTIEQVASLLDDRMKAQEEATAAAQQKQKNQEEANALITEAEGMGFQRGTPQFKMLFTMAVEGAMTLKEAKVAYDQAFAGVQPPPVPITSAQPSPGAVNTPVTEKISAADKLSARIDRAIAADSGLS